MDAAKISVFRDVAFRLIDHGFRIERFDQSIPWGGFFVISESQSQQFAQSFFQEFEGQVTFQGRVCPMIILVAPGKRQTWRYHYRRAELWKVLKGNVGVVMSNDDIEGDCKTYYEGQLLRLPQEIRHRFIGLEDWAVLAEMWQHIDPTTPSDERDIVRLQDDFKTV